MKHILVGVLSSADSKTRIHFLRHLAGMAAPPQSEGHPQDWVAVADDVAVRWRQQEGCGGLSLMSVDENEEELDREGEGMWCVEKMESIGQGIMVLLKSDLRLNGLAGQFFIECLIFIAAILCQDVGYQPDEPSVRAEIEKSLFPQTMKKSSDANPALLLVEQNMNRPTRRDAFYRSLVLYLVASLSENMTSDILDQADLSHLLGIISAIIECHVQLTLVKQHSHTASLDYRLLLAQPDLDCMLGGPITLSVALGYLSAVVGGARKV